MNKKQLFDAIKMQTTLTSKQCTDFYNAFVATIADGLKKGEIVTLPKIGKFYSKRTNKRQLKNPLTGNTIVVPAKNVVKFKMNKVFRDSL